MLILFLAPFKSILGWAIKQDYFYRFLRFLPQVAQFSPAVMDKMLGEETKDAFLTTDAVDDGILGLWGIYPDREGFNALIWVGLKNMPPLTSATKYTFLVFPCFITKPLV